MSRSPGMEIARSPTSCESSDRIVPRWPTIRSTTAVASRDEHLTGGKKSSRMVRLARAHTTG